MRYRSGRRAHGRQLGDPHRCGRSGRDGSGSRRRFVGNRRGRFRRRRQHAGRLELRQHVGDDRAIDNPPFLRVAEHERRVADDVDHARHAAAAQVNEVRRLARKLHRRAERGPAQPVIDVIRRLVRVERLQVIAHRDALPELLEFDRRQLVAQVRLADEHDLHQLRLLGLEIREHPQLFERAETEILRLVDHQQHVASGQPLLDQILREIAQQQRLALAGHLAWTVAKLWRRSPTGRRTDDAVARV